MRLTLFAGGYSGHYQHHSLQRIEDKGKSKKSCQPDCSHERLYSETKVSKSCQTTYMENFTRRLRNESPARSVDKNNCSRLRRDPCHTCFRVRGSPQKLTQHPIQINELDYWRVNREHVEQMEKLKETKKRNRQRDAQIRKGAHVSPRFQRASNRTQPHGTNKIKKSSTEEVWTSKHVKHKFT